MEEPEILLEMQDRDVRIMRLEKQLDEMPEKRAILQARAKIEEVRTLLERTRAAGHAVDAAVKRAEDEIAAVRGKMEAEQAKLLSGAVTAPKELQAISMELDGLKRRSDKLEDEEMALLEKREQATSQEIKVLAVLEVGERKEHELVAAFKARGGDILAQTEQLHAERDALAGKLSPALRDRYEALRSSKHGIATARLEGSMCGACRVSLPAGSIESLLAGPVVATCPNCNRILIVGEQ